MTPDRQLMSFEQVEIQRGLFVPRPNFQKPTAVEQKEVYLCQMCQSTFFCAMLSFSEETQKCAKVPDQIYTVGYIWSGWGRWRCMLLRRRELTLGRQNPPTPDNPMLRAQSYWHWMPPSCHGLHEQYYDNETCITRTKVQSRLEFRLLLCLVKELLFKTRSRGITLTS